MRLSCFSSQGAGSDQLTDTVCPVNSDLVADFIAGDGIVLVAIEFIVIAGGMIVVFMFR